MQRVFVSPRSSAALAALLLAVSLAGCVTTAAAPGAVATAPAAAASGAVPRAPSAAASGVVPRPPLTAASAAARPAAAASAPAAPAPGQPPAFATVIKDAKETTGLFSVWQKDEKVWLELKPEDFNKPFFLSPKISQGIGEAGLFGGTMIGRWGNTGRAQMVEFRRVHNIVQLVAVNSEYTGGDAKSPTGRAVAAAFSPSILAATTVASQAHPERKTVLVDIAPFFLSDMLGLGMELQRTYRQGYALEPRNTYFSSVRATPEQVVFNVKAHFYTASIAVPQPGLPPGAPVPMAPRSVPDARSMVMGLYYSIAKLPDVPMAPRVSDARVGYFTTQVNDFSNDLTRTPRQSYVNRWRLEKKDPAAALSEPVKPITYWLDRTIPLKYRDAISRGVLEWNKAFERIGFKNAVVVKVMPEDADFDTLDVGVASIRWMTNSQPNFGAIGPSQVDPRSGEILDADIGMESLSSRSVRALRSQVLAGRAAVDWPALLQARDVMAADPVRGAHAHAHRPGEACEYAEVAAEQLGYTFDVLEARGELDPSSPEAEQFVLDYLTDTTMHEVGHTLGLRHNFRSSRVYSDKQLDDLDFTLQNSLAGSVMEYAPINLPRPGQKGGARFQLVLGPYDYWAIEYGYKPIAADQERAELLRIAGRSGDPMLAYGTDEDNSLGIDPESLHFDLGSDPVAFARKRFDIMRDLLSRLEQRELKPEADYSVLRRSVGYAVRDAGRAAGVLARQIGGVRTLRDHPGTGRDPLLPVPGPVQREALEVLARGVLSAEAFRLSPSLQRKLAPDYAERTAALFAQEPLGNTDFSIVETVLGMQRTLIAQLMSDGVATRLLDSEGKVDRKPDGKPGDAFRLSELYGRMTREIWSELGSNVDIPAARRELQREHLNRIAGSLLRSSAASRADARSLLRAEARALLTRIQAASQRGALSAEARAHLADSAESLTLALEAKVQRSGI